ncbi:MAG: hypothetical protein AAFX99_09125, partial [Myxococcota bacterium]
MKKCPTHHTHHTHHKAQMDHGSTSPPVGRRRTLMYGLPVVVLMVLVAWTEVGPAAPIQDDVAGFWSDDFESTDTAPGRSLFSGEGVEFAGQADDGELRLIAPPIPDQNLELLQIDWSSGEVESPSTTVLFQSGFERVSDNILFENFPGRLVMAPIVGEQDGARPVRRFAITPIKGVVNDTDYYAFSDGSTNAAIPSQSSVTNLYFYRDRRNGNLSFLTVTNERESSQAPDGFLALAIDNLPEGTNLRFADDEGSVNVDGTNALGDWAWTECCSEGAGFRLPGDTFDFDVRVVAPSGGSLQPWIDAFTYRIYSEADINAFPFTLLQKPTNADDPEPVTVTFHGSRQGDLDSVVFDLGDLGPNGMLAYGLFRFEAEVAEGGQIGVRFRVGDSEEDLRAQEWSALQTASEIDLMEVLDAPRRFFQYRVEFALPEPILNSDGSTPPEPEHTIALRRIEMPYTISFAPILTPTGNGTSILIDPRPDPVSWQTVSWSGDDQGNPGNIVVDVLDGETFDVLKEGVAREEDISDIDAAMHPSLRLRVRLSQTVHIGVGLALIGEQWAVVVVVGNAITVAVGNP